MQPLHRLVLALGLAAASASSFAATTVYTSSASFLANVLPGAYTENFDGLPATPPSSYASGAFSYSLAAASGLYGSGTFIGTNQIDEALTINFTGGNISAIGGNFFATDLGDSLQSVAVTLTLSDGTSVTFTPTSLADSYRGFASTAAITSLTFSAPGQSLYASLDNLTVGVSAVPEPASMLLMALGVAGLLAARRRA